ncbi:MAG: J domain-containing protein [Nanoarchaeota archaeon]
MRTINAKGHEFISHPVRDSYDRRAQQFKNKIILALGKIGLTEDDVEIDLEPSAVKSAPASAAWYMEGHYMHYSHNSPRKYVENLSVVLKVIELEVDALIHGRKTIRDFITEFSEDKEVEKLRKEAREVLGIGEDVHDLNLIDANYKALAKKHHPDMPDGDIVKFKEINHAHKILKRELQ